MGIAHYPFHFVGTHRSQQTVFISSHQRDLLFQLSRILFPSLLLCQENYPPSDYTPDQLVEISVTLRESKSDLSLTHWSAAICSQGPMKCTDNKEADRKDRVLLDRQRDRYRQARSYFSPMTKKGGKLVHYRGWTLTLLATLLANRGTGVQLLSQRTGGGCSQSLSYVDPKKEKKKQTKKQESMIDPLLQPLDPSHTGGETVNQALCNC